MGGSLEVGGFLGTILWQSQVEKYCSAEAGYTELQNQNFPAYMIQARELYWHTKERSTLFRITTISAPRKLVNMVEVIVLYLEKGALCLHCIGYWSAPHLISTYVTAQNILFC